MDEHLTTYENPFKFSGKELDDVTGLYDHGARSRNPISTLWYGIDPLFEKYPDFSPYNYCAGNPVKLVDPDGREGIVVSGSPGNHNNRTHFLENGLNRAILAKKYSNQENENVTWLIYNDTENGYKKSDIDKYTKLAEKSGINVKVVSSVDDLVSYINDKNGKGSRSNDKITSFYYLGHATPGDLDVGYAGTGENFDPSDLKSSAFSKGCHVNVVGGCRTAVSDDYLFVPIEKSVVDQFAEILDKTSTVYGSNVRVFYSGGVRTDPQLLAPNKGEIITKKGEHE